ncbi:hypothetical protein DID88_003913 [Monilinia fructigena]|uniref:Uncharacterized protein n=1 Tax=Monilinia fructigena TaxID=38457 RepID=A0A395IVR4_9HELO|nr:hypothetical protein DID88_003913 [Monilinia fructigena]
MRLPNIPGYFDPTHPIYHSDFYQPETWQEWRDWQQRKHSQPNPSQRYQAVADFNLGKFSIEALKSAHYQMLAKKYELLRRSLPTWQSLSQEQFFTSFGKETSSKSGSIPSMDRNRFQGGKGRMGEQSRKGQFREERQTLRQRRGQQQLTLPKLQELHTLPRQPIRGPIHRREHKIMQQVKEKVKNFHDLVDTMMWTVDQDRELRMYFTKERLIKQLVNDPALKHILQALIYESRALSQQLNGGETKRFSC